MSRLKVNLVGEGQHPSEAMVSVKTREGISTLIVDRRSLENNTLDVGYPVGGDQDYALVELPRETMGGEWRIFVPRSAIVDGVPA